MMSAEKGLVSVCACILFAYVSCQVAELGIICDKGFCQWRPNTIYTGCLPEDVPVLEFTYFDASSHIDLSCTSVQILSIQSTELTCNRVTSLLLTPRPITLLIGGTSCVSIDNKPPPLTQVHNLSMNFIANYYGQQPRVEIKS